LRTDSVLVRGVCESRVEGTVEHTKRLEVANAAAIYCLIWTHSAETTTPSHTSLPSLRRAQGRVKLSAFTCMQRCGITKLARLGATHPVVRIKNIDPSRANLSIIFFSSKQSFDADSWMQSNALQQSRRTLTAE